MNEIIKIQNEDESTSRLREYILLAEKLSKQSEGFSFPGIDPEAYTKLTATDLEFPGFTTPTDEIKKRMEQEKIKVTLGKHKNSGNVYILPMLSDSIENDSLSPQHLNILDGMDESLKELILLNRGM